jgi:hypothetical protein
VEIVFNGAPKPELNQSRERNRNQLLLRSRFSFSISGLFPFLQFQFLICPSGIVNRLLSEMIIAIKYPTFLTGSGKTVSSGFSKISLSFHRRRRTTFGENILTSSSTYGKPDFEEQMQIWQSRPRMNVSDWKISALFVGSGWRSSAHNLLMPGVKSWTVLEPSCASGGKSRLI